ncbi:hypothetical protein SDC9_135435 [bioreactor metagenome]|uniref:Uncharacterized protein n=1 Tax=bioreactor metagenome TaxID=1076179 RepID=A0A645DHN9_9ZZZZ
MVVKYDFVHFAVRTLTTDVTVPRRNIAITHVEALLQSSSFTDINNLPIHNPEVDTWPITGIDGKSAESTFTMIGKW